MKKLDIRKDIQTRKYKLTWRPFYWFYHLVMKIMDKKHHSEYVIIDDINKEKGPCFVIFNHLSRLDHMYVLNITYPKQVNILAGYCEFFRSHLHWAFKKNNVLPKKNYGNDVTGIKAIMSIIKQGGTVAFAPEGLATNDGINKPIVPFTGGMLKKFGIPVYFVKLEGQYLQNTKTCLDERLGKTKATISLLLSPDDLKQKSVKEIDDLINEAFRHDEYKWQKEQHIKWTTHDRMCHHLEELFFECPKCHQLFTMKGERNTIRCTACHNEATLDEYYEFHPTEGSIILDASEWRDSERQHIIDEIRTNPDFKFEENVKIGRLPNDHYLKDLKTSEVVDVGKLIVDHAGMRFIGKTSNYDFNLNYNEVYTLITEVDSSYCNLYVNGEYTDIYPERPVSIYLTYLIEEMHRLHVNTYKCLPWYEYMYEKYNSKKEE